MHLSDVRILIGLSFRFAIASRQRELFPCSFDQWLCNISLCRNKLHCSLLRQREPARHRGHCLCEPVTTQSLLGQQESQLSTWTTAPNKPPYGADKHAGIWSSSVKLFQIKRMKIWMRDPYRNHRLLLWLYVAAIICLGFCCSQGVKWTHDGLTEKNYKSQCDWNQRSRCLLLVWSYVMV